MGQVIFIVVVLVFAIGLGLISRKKKDATLAKRADSDTTVQQGDAIVQALLPGGTNTYKAVPAAVGLTASQAAASGAKDLGEKLVLSVLLQRQVHVNSDTAPDDNYMFAYGSSDFYIIPLKKHYKEIRIEADKETKAIHVTADMIEKYKYNEKSGAATIVLKENGGAFKLIPQLAYFDKPDEERLAGAKAFLSRLKERVAA